MTTIRRPTVHSPTTSTPVPGIVYIEARGWFRRRSRRRDRQPGRHVEDWNAEPLLQRASGRTTGALPAAPGSGIYSTYPNRGSRKIYGYIAGHVNAAAHVKAARRARQIAAPDARMQIIGIMRKQAIESGA